VRTAVETGVKKIRAKTVRAVVGHITQTLPGPDEGYCEPLVKDYFKTLRVVLGYPPHAEHFSKGEWCDLVDFCNETLHDLNSITSEKSSNFPNGNSTKDSWRSGPSRSATPGVDVDHRHRASHVSSQENGMLQLRNCAEELVLCLYHLTSVPHAAILDKAPVALANLLELLESSSSAGNAQQAAFECINSIMARIMTDDVSLALQTLKNLLPTMRRLWDAKTSALKDHMLKLMLHGEVYFPRLISSDEADDCKSNIKGLLEALQQDYCKRPEREQLQLEDLLFSNNGSVGKRPSSTKIFELRSGASKAEKSWFLLSIYASLILGLDSDLKIREKIAQADELENPPKRRKVTRNLDDIFQSVRTTETTQKLFALQVLTFVFAKLPVEGDGLDWNLEALLPCLSDDNGSVASWAMLALARCDFFYAKK
jgi:serine-protein kinase ATM